MAIDNRTALDKLHQQRAATAGASAADYAGTAVISGSQDLEMRHAVFHVISIDNGLGLDQKQSETEPGQPSQDDPTELGFGAWSNPLGRLKFYICKIRFDVLRWVQGRLHRTEVAFLKAAIDELVDMDGKPLPLIALYMTENTTDSTDQAEQPVMIWTRKGIRCLVPMIFEAGAQGLTGAGGGSSRVTRFYTDGGMFCVNMQDDPLGITEQHPEGVRVPRAVKYQIIPTAAHPNIVTADESTWVAIGESEL